MLKIKLKKLNSNFRAFKSWPEKLAEKSFFAFLVLFLIVLIISLVICYYYIFLTGTSGISQSEQLLKLDREAQWRVLGEWQRRNENFHQADFKEYPDPFK